MSNIKLSIVIPVHNEESILTQAVDEFITDLEKLNLQFEIVLAENGSTDRTLAIARELSGRDSRVRFLHVQDPNYGAALRCGIAFARGQIVVCEEIDLCDIDFCKRAIQEINSGADFVIGSKLLASSKDNRPRMRHGASLVYNGLLKLALGFRGTDTHGLKAFRREKVLPISQACLVDKDVFASELVVRSYRANLRIQEIPVIVAEKRPPSIHLLRRVPNVIRNLAKLYWAIRIQG